MDENRPQRRRELQKQEKKNLERQRRRELELERKKDRREARLREQARAQARSEGEDPRVVVQIPAAPQKPVKKKRRKTLPEIIEKETDKKVRDLDPTDHREGYYVDEVGVRKKEAEKIHERREKKLPKNITPKQRRIRRIAAYIAIIVTVILVGIVLSMTVLFKAETIEVKGNKFYDDSVIAEYAGVKEGDNIFTAAMFADTKEVLDNLPYIKSAKVTFKIPNKIIITVENQDPFYALKSDGNIYLVSKENRILEKVSKKPKGLMFVETPKLKSDKIGATVQFEKERYTTALEQITKSLSEHNFKYVTEISVKMINDITLTYDDRIVIRLGLPDDLDYKIRTAFAIITTKLDPNNARTIRGVLNVSNCNNGKKMSYFNEVVEVPTEAPTEKPTEAPTEPPAQNTDEDEDSDEGDDEDYVEGDDYEWDEDEDYDDEDSDEEDEEDYDDYDEDEDSDDYYDEEDTEDGEE